MLLNTEVRQEEKKEGNKIQTEIEVHNPELAKKKVQAAIEQLNQEIGQEAYEISSERTVYDAYGIGTLVIFIQYLDHNLSPLEICITAGPNDLKKGINPEPETLRILLQAATIQLKAGLSKNGELLKRNGNSRYLDN